MSALRVRIPSPAPTNVELIAEALREAIISGQIPPGERIKEIPLARRLGVSRGPIREALRLLEHDGLLRIVPNRGAHVPRPAAPDLLEVYAMRAALGSLALHRLMLDRGRIPRAALKAALARLERAVGRRDAPAAADADLAYQSALVSGAGLARVARQFEQLTWQVQIFIATMGIRYDDQLEVMLSEVRELHEAIAGQDAALAERLWREKFERWVRHFLDQMSEGFDRELWLALTSGPAQRPPAEAPASSPARGEGAVA
jgi:DNA-binding GntR family transcriptional regulator